MRRRPRDVACASRPSAGVVVVSRVLASLSLLELGTWVNGQRAFRKAFQKPAEDRTESEKKNAAGITERRIELLDGIDFDWAPQAGRKKRKKNGQ